MATDVKNDATLGSDLIAYYRLEESSGERVDEVAADNLTDNNTVTSESAIQGNGAVFVIANAEYLSAGPASTALSGGSWTVAGWFKIADVTALQCLWSWGDNIFINISATNLRLQINDSSSNDVNSSATTRSNGTFYHIAVTSSGTGAGATKIWINGTQDDDGAAINFNIDSGNFHIGRQETGETRYMGGTADEVGIWSKVLAEAQIDELYNAGAGIPWDAGGGAAVSTINSLSLLGVT